MSNGTIPAEPVDGSRVFKTLSREDFNDAANPKGNATYRRARVLLDAVDCGLSSRGGVLDSMSPVGVDVVGVEAFVDGANQQTFSQISCALGLTSLWMIWPPEVVSGPHIYLFAHQGADGPMPVQSQPKPEANLFVGHYTGPAVDQNSDEFCTRLATWLASGRTGEGQTLLTGEYRFPQLSLPAVNALLIGSAFTHEEWYIYGNHLDIRTVREDVFEFSFYRENYQHFEWLMKLLGFRDTSGEESFGRGNAAPEGVSVPPHRSVRFGGADRPNWSSVYDFTREAFVLAKRDQFPGRKQYLDIVSGIVADVYNDEISLPLWSSGSTLTREEVIDTLVANQFKVWQRFTPTDSNADWILQSGSQTALNQDQVKQEISDAMTAGSASQTQYLSIAGNSSGWNDWAGEQTGTWYTESTDYQLYDLWEKPKAVGKPKHDFQKVTWFEDKIGGTVSRTGWNMTYTAGMSSHQNIPSTIGWDPKDDWNACGNAGPHVAFNFKLSDGGTDLNGLLWLTPKEAFLEFVNPGTPGRKTSTSKWQIGRWTVVP